MKFVLKLPIDEIIRAYEVDKLSLNAIGQNYHTSADIIKSRLICAGISLRPKSECMKIVGLKSREWFAKAKSSTNTSQDEKPLGLKKGKVNKSAIHLRINRFEIFARDGFRCRYCGKTPQEDGVKLCVEHIIPKSQGGSDATANLITACYNCNISKRNKALLSKNKQIPSFIAITTLR